MKIDTLRSVAESICYNFSLSLRSFRKTPGVTLLSCLAIALGISACMTMITVRYAMTGDPFPEKSDRIFHVQVDTRMGQARKGSPLDGVNYSDSHELLTLPLGAKRSTATFSTQLSVGLPNQAAELALVRGATSDFFGMFNIRFVNGAPWTSVQDDQKAQLVILSKNRSLRLFGKTDVVGESVKIGGQTFRVSGVMEGWRPAPRFFDLSNGAYSRTEEFFIPVTAAIAIPAEPAYMSCWGDPGPPDQIVAAPCGWLQFWVETESASDRYAYRQKIVSQLSDYGIDDADGRVIIRSLPEWLSFKDVVPRDIDLQTVLAFAFLGLCTVNMAGLLMMKYLDRTRELAIRMAMGASRKTIAGHVLSESIIIGVTGTLLGIPLGLLGVYFLKKQPFAYAEVIQFDPLMVLLTAGVGLAAAITAALLAIWRVSRVSPASLMGR